MGDLASFAGPGFYIPDPDFIHLGSDNSTKRGEEKKFCPTIFCSHKYHKIVNNFIFEQERKIVLPKH
jgi:hypothetical protein